MPGTEWIAEFDGTFSLSELSSRLHEFSQLFVLDLGRTHARRHVLRELLGRVTNSQFVSLAREPERGVTCERLLTIVHELFPGEFTCPTGLGEDTGMLTLQRRSPAPRWNTEASTGLSVCMVSGADAESQREAWYRALAHMVQVLPPGAWELLTDGPTASDLLASVAAPIRVVEPMGEAPYRGARKNQLARAAQFSDCLFLSAPIELPVEFFTTLVEFARGLTIATPRLRTTSGARGIDWLAVQAETVIEGHTALLDYRATSRWALTGGEVLLARASVLAAHPFIDCLGAGDDHELVRRLQRHGLDPVCLPVEAMTLVGDQSSWPMLPYLKEVEFAPVAPVSHGVVTVVNTP